ALAVVTALRRLHLAGVRILRGGGCEAAAGDAIGPAHGALVDALHRLLALAADVAVGERLLQGALEAALERSVLGAGRTWTGRLDGRAVVGQRSLVRQQRRAREALIGCDGGGKRRHGSEQGEQDGAHRRRAAPAGPRGCKPWSADQVFPA